MIDGRTLERPVNYALARIIPPKGVEIDPRRRPFVVVDPRAGHGPGIGGFKADSEIGVAFKAGHPCYFVGFLPDPVPGQTLEDVARAEAVFLEKVITLHPDADAKPCVIGNCQAGWAVMMLAAMRPELFGPIIVAGSPLSYWGGVHGKYPMRYSGGLLGGSWLTALTSDLGHGKFDGTFLVQNFENQNPANTLWTKQYNLYANIDSEAPRYLGFERWWGGHVNLNGGEIQAIVDDLFIGNKLAAGMIKGSDGTMIDLRNIRSPIVVFCSKGDNVTPPQQALGWILDLYDDVDDIRRHGQTIVYTIHESAGHLGIFVSTGVARKEYGEFSNNIDLIDVLPPGLYEAVFEAKREDTASPDLVTGDWVMRCEARTLHDIRALGGNDAADERRFATAARVSEINLALYRTLAQPMVRAMTSEPAAEWLRRLHPLRLQYDLLSDENAWMAPVAAMAEEVRENRQPAAADNPFLATAGDRLRADRRRPQCLAGWGRNARRAHVSYGLRQSAAAGRGRHRPGGCAAAAQGGKDAAPSRAGGGADRRAEIAHRRRRRARRRHSRAPLCRHAAGRRRRARVRGHSPDARNPGRDGAADAGRVQGHGARAVLHAAHRSGGGFRRASRAASRSLVAAEDACRRARSAERRR